MFGYTAEISAARLILLGVACVLPLVVLGVIALVLVLRRGRSYVPFLVTCPGCGRKVFRPAASCPRCGRAMEPGDESEVPS